MTDTKKLIETMDCFIRICADSGGYKDCEHCCEDNIKNCDNSENGYDIKQILEQQAQPGDELVEKIVYECLDFIAELPDEQVSSVKKLKWVNAYRKLLQSRRPEKATITREEIRCYVSAIQNCGTSRPCSHCIDSLAELFKSSGIEAKE